MAQIQSSWTQMPNPKMWSFVDLIDYRVIHIMETGFKDPILYVIIIGDPHDGYGMIRNREGGGQFEMTTEQIQKELPYLNFDPNGSSDTKG